MASLLITNEGPILLLSPTITLETVILTNLTDGYIPYHVSDTAGLANSIIYNTATSVLINNGTSGSANTNLRLGGIGGWSDQESHCIDWVYNTVASPTTLATLEVIYAAGTGKVSFNFRNMYNAGNQTAIMFSIDAAGLTSIPTGKLGIGTATVPHGAIGAAKLAIEGTNASTAGPHVQFTTATDDYPLLQVLNYSHDGVFVAFDSYWDGSWKSSDVGTNFMLMKYSDLFQIWSDTGIAQGSTITWDTILTLTAAGILTTPHYHAGINDTTYGTVVAYGHATGSAQGGELGLFTAADHDTTIDYYLVQAYEDDLLIGPSTDTDALKLTAEGLLVFTMSGAKVGIGTATVPHAGIGTAQIAIDGSTPFIQFTVTGYDYPPFSIYPASVSSSMLVWNAYIQSSTWYHSTDDWSAAYRMYQNLGRLLIEAAYHTPGAAGDAVTAWYPAFTVCNQWTPAYAVFGMNVATPPRIWPGQGGCILEIVGMAGSLAPAIWFSSSSDAYPTLMIMGYDHDHQVISFDTYWWSNYYSSDAGSNFRIFKNSDLLKFDYASGKTAGAIFTWDGTALTITATGKIGFGTETVPHGGVGLAKLAIEGPNASNDGPHIQITTASDDYPLLQILPYEHNNISIWFDSYFNGSASKSSSSTANFKIQDYQYVFTLEYANGFAAGATITWKTALSLDARVDSLVSNISFVIGSGAAGVDYSLTFNGETNDGIITWMEDEAEFRFSGGASATNIAAFGSIADTAIYLYRYLDQSYIDSINNSSTAQNLYLNTRLTGGKVGVGYANSGAGLLASLDAKASISTVSSYGVAWFQNAYDTSVNPTIAYPVVGISRVAKSGEHYSSTMFIGIAQWEDSGTTARSEAKFSLVHGDNGYFDITLLGLRSDGVVTIGDGTAGKDFILQFDGETNDCTLTWMEDEAALRINQVFQGYSTANAATEYFSILNTAGWTASTRLHYFSWRDSASTIVAALGASYDVSGDVSVYIGCLYKSAYTSDWPYKFSPTGMTIGSGMAGVDYTLAFNGETNDLTLTYMEDEDYLKTSSVFRAATSLYRRYYHVDLASTNPGASGATWVAPSANSAGGWQLNAATEVLYGETDVHADWDAATDLKCEVTFEVNVDNSGGGAGDTVDLKLVLYYKGDAETACKTQTVEVAKVVGASARYKQFEAEFTINFDEIDNVVQAGDKIGFILNLETDTSEVDDIIVNSMSYYYNTTHIGLESGDT